MKKFKKIAVIGATVLVVSAISVTAFAFSESDVSAVSDDQTTTACEFQPEMLERKKDILTQRVEEGTIPRSRRRHPRSIEANQADCDGTCSGGIGSGLGAAFRMGNGVGTGSGTGLGNGSGVCDGTGAGGGFGTGSGECTGTVWAAKRRRRVRRNLHDPGRVIKLNSAIKSSLAELPQGCLRLSKNSAKRNKPRRVSAAHGGKKSNASFRGRVPRK